MNAPRTAIPIGIRRMPPMREMIVIPVIQPSRIRKKEAIRL